MSGTARPVLHVPDEPTKWAERWLDSVHDGLPLDDVLTGADGFTAWLWSRWRSLGAAGFSEADLAQVVAGYGREVWLWLAGDRTWAQCCSGLIGRIDRRLALRDGAGA